MEELKKLVEYVTGGAVSVIEDKKGAPYFVAKDPSEPAAIRLCNDMNYKMENPESGGWYSDRVEKGEVI